ncbi:MAG: NupC/NupG family nucleoside CNT transporter [Candidatus Marinimicrobia bacterium]|jgi:CNT family concentrative nucleoside transporter|nr:NupC/NupG family nucleoside CNT transporter [Candidatus Neomarinimicrobiota bacterium]MBT3675193.1 NupC/NupG family nucleoside CNT transporter [Candidatus Neomarinimicrobiota bacterium]MBT4069562.1 NupC/NupG family nucleoside CNT transporter [Candidatus Neomarinimicrobiota bacterium]MBT4271330.1 NupC/NupG family nucleoside CNT transporter [Candidatus Neomarinimicrobiota bacterium]MBT4372003.1 NupC/NupG family nucleoside CNT transporter [Candidatus Neomarinimicrobiota bacterium]
MIGLLGIVVLLGIAVAMSNNRKKINLRIVGWGLGLQLTFALFILKTPIGKPVFGFLDKAISKLISFSDAGGNFLFTSFVPDVGFHTALINFAFRALPTIIFFSALMSVMYHLGIIQFVVRWIAKAMQKTMGTSGSETLSVSANIFVGQTEAPLMIRPFIGKMTQSELMAVMVGGFATVAGGVLAIYVKWLTDIPGIAGHLLAASVMSAPAALVIAKIIYPETEISETMGDIKIDIEKTSSNAMEALGNGATDGLKLAANVAAMLVAFISIVAMVNYLLGFANTSIDQLLGLIFQPLAWTMGVPWEESAMMGTLMGKKIAFTELIAYGDLKVIMASGQISERTAIIASYALCGFANFGSIGIQLGGIGGMAPERKKDLAKLVTKAMVGGALASWLTATVAGILI